MLFCRHCIIRLVFCLTLNLCSELFSKRGSAQPHSREFAVAREYLYGVDYYTIFTNEIDKIWYLTQFIVKCTIWL